MMNLEKKRTCQRATSSTAKAVPLPLKGKARDAVDPTGLSHFVPLPQEELCPGDECPRFLAFPLEGKVAAEG